MSFFERIKQGLNEAIAYERGEIEATVSHGYVAPLPSFSAQEIKDIREATGSTQWLFAQYMGVSVKTVEAWEAGRNAQAVRGRNGNKGYYLYKRYRQARPRTKEK